MKYVDLQKFIPDSGYGNIYSDAVGGYQKCIPVSGYKI